MYDEKGSGRRQEAAQNPLGPSERTNKDENRRRRAGRNMRNGRG
jgi:hypothetical protein